MVFRRVILDVLEGFDRGIPILFFSAKDFLNRLLLLQQVASSALQPMHCLGRVSCPTHLLYANDVLLFCHATQMNISKLSSILPPMGYFQDKLFSRPSRRSIMILVSWTGGCEYECYGWDLQRSASFQHLDVSLFQGSPRRCWLQYLADRVLARLTRWKGKLFLTLGGLL